MTFLRGLKRGWAMRAGDIFSYLPLEGFPQRSTRRRAIVSLALCLVLCSVARAQSFRVLHTFGDAPHRPDGDYPSSALISDGAGNLYGATAWGGALGSGILFKINTSGAETVIYSFPASVGFNDKWITSDSVGNLYGTSNGGGIGLDGTVFEFDSSKHGRPLFSFSNNRPLAGYTPVGNLFRDSNGDLYGSTAFGGVPDCNFGFGCGLVFKLDSAGNETVLHNFAGAPTDGRVPNGGLIRDAAGNYYGTTQHGGAFDYGIVFKLDANFNETILYTFTGDADGGNPVSGLIMDEAGNLYGTTSGGGLQTDNCYDGCGVVYKLDPAGVETVLYTFQSGNDGAEPVAGLIRDSAGNLYGTTWIGGPYTCFNSSCGTAFKLDPTGHETILHTFSGGKDGGQPVAPLLLNKGHLFGTASAQGFYGQGTVFEIIP